MDTVTWYTQPYEYNVGEMNCVGRRTESRKSHRAVLQAFENAVYVQKFH